MWLGVELVRGRVLSLGICRRDKHSEECCRQKLTKPAPRLHDRILREPLLAASQPTTRYAVVFNSIGELRNDFFFSRRFFSS